MRTATSAARAVALPPPHIISTLPLRAHGHCVGYMRPPFCPSLLPPQSPHLPHFTHLRALGHRVSYMRCHFIDAGPDGTQDGARIAGPNFMVPCIIGGWSWSALYPFLYPLSFSIPSPLFPTYMEISRPSVMPALSPCSLTPMFCLPPRIMPSPPPQAPALLGDHGAQRDARLERIADPQVHAAPTPPAPAALLGDHGAQCDARLEPIADLQLAHQICNKG